MNTSRLDRFTVKDDKIFKLVTINGVTFLSLAEDITAEELEIMKLVIGGNQVRIDAPKDIYAHTFLTPTTSSCNIIDTKKME